MEEKYIVELERPRNISVSRMKAYIQEAVETWGGQYKPGVNDDDAEGDPLFGGVACKVKRLTTKE